MRPTDARVVVCKILVCFKVGRMIRNSDEPFGGIQLIVCGDFLQLPPVAKKGEDVAFCFEVITVCFITKSICFRTVLKYILINFVLRCAP